jgi:hypothetical protein
MKGVYNMAIKKYIGARYAPKFMGAWDKASEYAALSVVYTNDQSYVSRKTVPANTEITNTEFWIKSADWNAQVTQYNQNVEQYQANVEQYNQNVETYNQAVDQFYADTLHSYDTKADMVADRSLKLGNTLLTCGNATIGDGGGSFYQVVGETSAKAVALENGLFALPFEFQPYDYSEFQDEVDRVVESFGTSVAEIKAASLGTYDNVTQMKADTTLKANTTVLTTGEATVGDNKGSFYRVQDTSDRPDAVPLDNGKKAIPFALDVGAVAGTALTFTGKSDAAAVWNVKAPGTVTIPLSVSAGGTATVFLGVLYGASQSSVKATLSVNSTVQRDMTFTDSGDATHDKIVVYAITVKRTDGYYFGSSAVSSWTTEYQYDTVTITQQIGEGAPLAADGEEKVIASTTFGVFTPTKNVIIKKVSIKTKKAVIESSYEPVFKIYKLNDTDNKLYQNNDAIPANTVKTYNPNIELVSGTAYAFSFSLVIESSGLFQTTYAKWTQITPPGTYGELNLSYPQPNQHQNINCLIEYDVKRDD